MDKPRILWFSISPYEAHSFGQQTRITCNALAKLGYDVHVVGWRNPTPTHRFDNFYLHPCRIFPSKVETNKFWEIIESNVKKINPDIVIFHENRPRYRGILMWPGLKERPFLFWCPYEWEKSFQEVEDDFTRIPYLALLSNFAYKLFRPKVENLFLIHHGVDPKEYFPLDKEGKLKIRKELDLNANYFIVGSIFANVEIRKGQTRLLEAFSRFAKDKDDVLLYLHTAKNPQGADLDYYIDYQFKIKDKVRFTGFAGLMGVEPNILNKYFYNAIDVNVLATAGEGWGLPVVEAMLAKVPTIMTDCSSAPELIGQDRGWRAKVTAYDYNLRGIEKLPAALVDIDDLVKKLNRAYQNRRELKRRGTNAYNHAQKHFVIDKTIREFDQVLMRIFKESKNKYPNAWPGGINISKQKKAVFELKSPGQSRSDLSLLFFANKPRRLKQALSRLLANNHQITEVFVASNRGLPGQLAKEAKSAARRAYGGIVPRSSKANWSAAVNWTLKKARNKVVFVLDDNCVFQGRIPDDFFTPFSTDNGLIAAKPKLIGQRNRRIEKDILAIDTTAGIIKLLSFDRPTENVLRCDLFSPFFFVIKKELALEAGGFDETLTNPAAAVLDFCWRLKTGPSLQTNYLGNFTIKFQGTAPKISDDDWKPLRERMLSSERAVPDFINVARKNCAASDEKYNVLGRRLMNQEFYRRLNLPQVALNSLEYAQKLIQKDKTLSKFLPNIQALKGDCWQKMGQTAKALKVFKSILKRDPKNIEAINNLSDYYFGQEAYQKVIRLLGKIDNNAASLYLKGMAHFELGHHKEALRCLSLMEQLDPGSIDGQKALALFHYNRGNYPEAIRHCLRIITLAPEDKATHTFLAKLYRLQENLK